METGSSDDDEHVFGGLLIVAVVTMAFLIAFALWLSR